MVTSTKILQQPLQMLAREEDAAFYSAKRQGEPLGNLAVFKARNVHKKGNAVLAWQAVHNTVNLFTVVIILCYIIIELLGAVHVEKIIGVVDKCLVAYLFAVVVYENIAHNGIYPPFEIGVGSIFVHITKRFQ